MSRRAEGTKAPFPRFNTRNTSRSQSIIMYSSTPKMKSSSIDPGKTPPIEGNNGIAEVKFLPLGGVDQWVMIRGHDVESNPILVLLHGGPGMSETTFWRFYNSDALEKAFTVVYWDQRGSGKSFDPKRRPIPKATMNVEQFISDLDELVDKVCIRCNKKQVVIFGHSWGSFLGPLYTARFPSKVAAYIGCGQLGDWARSERLTYAYAVSEAERRGMKRALRELRQVGEPPHDCKGLMTQRNWLADLDGDTSLAGIWRMIKIFHSVPEASLWDMFRVYKTLEFSIDSMWAEVTALNLLKEVPELKVPTFFLLGSQDHCVFPEISKEFVENLKAPTKEVVWFEKSEHLPFMTEPNKFNDTMVNLVRPALQSTGKKVGDVIVSTSC